MKKYYYKNQWLNFELAKENPCDIKWENCYISTWKKFGRRILSILISIGFIIIIAVIMIFVEIDKENDKSNLNYVFMISITQVINIVSSLILNKFTKFEKYTSKSKEIFSDISKYFWLNFYYQ